MVISKVTLALPSELVTKSGLFKKTPNSLGLTKLKRTGTAPCTLPEAETTKAFKSTESPPLNRSVLSATKVTLLPTIVSKLNAEVVCAPLASLTEAIILLDEASEPACTLTVTLPFPSVVALVANKLPLPVGFNKLKLTFLLANG